MASSSTSPPCYGEHQIEAAAWLLVHMEPKSIQDYAKARYALGKEELAYRFKALKDLQPETLAIVLQEAKFRGDPKRVMPPTGSQAQPAEKKLLKRPHASGNASETKVPNPRRQLELLCLAGECKRCMEPWVWEAPYHNHFTSKHSSSTTFKTEDGQRWMCDPKTCGEEFTDPKSFTEHIWKKHMRVVTGQQPAQSRTPVGASGCSPPPSSVPHTVGDDMALSLPPTSIPRPPSASANASTPNATANHTSALKTSASTQFSVGAQTSELLDMQLAGAYPGNGYPHVVDGNNNYSNMLHGMPDGNLPYYSNLYTVMPEKSITYSEVGRKRARTLAYDSGQNQSLSTLPASNTAVGQTYSTLTDHNFGNVNQNFGQAQ